MDADHGNYQWEMGGELPVNGTVYFTHKHCCHAFEESHPGPLWGAEELVCLLPFLAKNLNLKWRKAEQYVRMQVSFGNAG